MKTVVFDFDDTLTTFDTVFPFLFFANKDGKIFKSLKKSSCLFLRILFRLNWISNFHLKDWSVKLLIGGYPDRHIVQCSRDFFERVTFHRDVYEELESCVADAGTRVIVSTASFSEYVLHLKEAFPELVIQASRLDYENGRVTGLRCNNHGAVKLEALKERQIDVLYTDSLSDLPLARRSGEIIKISKTGRIQRCENLDDFIRCCRSG